MGDLGYIRQEIKKTVREKWGVAVVTKLKPDMNLIEPFDQWNEMSCLQGQPLQWLGYEARDQLHWFGPKEGPRLCDSCWQASQCPKEFSYRADLHETLLGLLPLNTVAAARLLSTVRNWIEPAQSYEKNLRGLKRMFLKSLRLTWTVSLLADSVTLLRALALVEQADPDTGALRRLLPKQLNLGLEN